MRPSVFLLYLLLLVSACKKEADPEPGDFPELENGQMMLACAEGNFRWGNAEAGLVNLRTFRSNWSAFSSKNKRPLGDVLQSAAFWNGRLWLVVNNSGRLEGIDPGSFELKESITGLTSPRFLQAVSEEKAFVTDLYADGIWVLKKGSNRPERKIPMPGWTEEMVFSDGLVWICCRTRPFLLGLNPATEAVEDSLHLPGNGRSLCRGPGGSLWVGFEKGSGPGPGLWLVHPDAAAPLKSWNADGEDAVPDRLCSSVSGDTVFFLSQGPCRLNDNGFQRYEAGSGNWYGLGWDPRRRQLWLSDVKDYQQASEVRQLDYNGNLLRSWSGGILVSRFYFW